MTDREWMYSGHPSQKDMTDEWLSKTYEFLQTAFSKGQPKTWCPCTKCKNYSRQTKDVMGKHLQMRGFTPGYTCGHFMVSRPNVTETRCCVGAPTIMVQGLKTWSMILMMLGTRTKRWRNPQRPSMPCWSLQNVLFTSTLRFLS